MFRYGLVVPCQYGVVVPRPTFEHAAWRTFTATLGQDLSRELAAMYEQRRLQPRLCQQVPVCLNRKCFDLLIDPVELQRMIQRRIDPCRGTDIHVRHARNVDDIECCRHRFQSGDPSSKIFRDPRLAEMARGA